MKICLLGESSRILDEGMRKTSFCLAQELSKNEQVMLLDLRRIFSKTFLKEIREFNPDVIHYVHGPSLKSFILLKFVSFFCSKSKTVMSAMHPLFSSLSKILIPLLRPDLILVQSEETEKVFKSLRCKTKFLPCGVNPRQFLPATYREKNRLRERYRVSKERFVILHVGPIKKGRNLGVLEDFQRDNNLVILIVASPRNIDQEFFNHLKNSGCIIWTDYFDHIEDVYALSDCYVFPTIFEKNLLGKPLFDSIEMPLSVLEAMACDLPVISTRFGALPRIFEEGTGLIYVDKEEDFLRALNRIKSGLNVRTREKVLPYSWDNVARRLRKIYANLTFE